MRDPLIPVVEIETPDNVVLRFEIAGLGRRALAAGIDLAVQIGLSIVVGLLALGVALGLGLGAGAVGGAVAGTIVGGALMVNFLVWWAYFVVCEMTMNGQSIGKRKMGIRVVRTDGRSIGFLQSALRNVIRAADMLPLLYGVGTLAVLFSRWNQRLGDFAAATMVITQEPQAPPAYLMVDLERVPLDETTKGAVLSRVSAVKQEEYEYVIRLLTRLPELSPANPAEADRLVRETTRWLAHSMGILPERPLDYPFCVSFLQCVVAGYGRRSVGV